jgi:hypothetical protein
MEAKNIKSSLELSATNAAAKSYAVSISIFHCKFAPMFGEVRTFNDFCTFGTKFINQQVHCICISVSIKIQSAFNGRGRPYIPFINCSM